MVKAMKKPPKSKSRALSPRTSRSVAHVADRLLADVRELIEAARQHVAREVNASMVLLYWHIGKRVREDILHEQRAQYGKRIVATLSKQLTSDYGRGYSTPNLSRMMRLAEAFPDERIVATLSQQLGWSHFKEVIPLGDDLKRDFYAEMCRIEGWSVRILREDSGDALRTHRDQQKAGRSDPP